jgi:rhodanese-related sulfurtransferase
MVREMTATEVAAWLSSAAAKPLILDVREAWEVERATIAGSTWIPMNQIIARVNELDRKRDVVVVCHHGARSYQVALYLLRQGFAKVVNLRGGLDAWSQSVDATVARY